jgi:transposase
MPCRPRRMDVVPSLIYRWRQELRTAAPGFAEVVVAPAPDERTAAGRPAMEIELGRDIRVRIAATAPKELASAIVKVLVAR